MVDWVWRDGSRLTPWMAYQIGRLDADFHRRWGVHILVTDGIRTCEEQERIFRDRYRLAKDVNGRHVYDTRWWNGARWYRISPLGTVAPPCTSNHNMQGSFGAVDLRDSGSDAGVTIAGTPRARWLRENAHKYDMEPEGYNFQEPWHYRFRNIFKTPPTSGGASKPKGIAVKHYFRDDGKALRKGGIDLAPNAGTWLHTDSKVAASQASNIVGGVGEYSFVAHVYVEGKPGDVVDLVLAWDNTKTSGAHSMHFVERIEIGADGTARRNVPFARAVAAGFAVYARLAAPASNKGAVKVTRLATDALLLA